ncbi:MAG: dTDP-glucose 4,6-dehydratase [Armatimonadetes bacterium]|nr:dTDP-glucose 4,6-dehydratase [Akkermansiaceae bacterium]
MQRHNLVLAGMDERAANGKRVMVTGGCGFIGGHLLRKLLELGHEVLNVDRLTYAANTALVEEFGKSPGHTFLQADVADEPIMRLAMADFRPQWIFHLAAETHVDRSIEGPLDFLRTNVLGTGVLLEAARAMTGNNFRFIHISTDEVYGSLGLEGTFDETSQYSPRSPYSASKAGSDHLVRAWYETYGLPVIVTHCGNNYGTGQFPEKLIPMTITRALAEEEIPIYGNGCQVRDWVHVDDHVDALIAVGDRGAIGDTYDIGARDEWRNIDLVRKICGILDDLRPRASAAKYADLIRFVSDRPGHDFRYAINSDKIEAALGWKASRRIDSSLVELVENTVSP